MVSVFFADKVNAKARQTSMRAYIILAIPSGDRETMQPSSAYSMPHNARRNIVHGRLRSLRRRRFLQVHQLGEDGQILAESLEDNGQHDCEKDVEQ